MSRTPRQQSFVIVSLLLIIVASMALALPAAASVRQAIGPHLPMLVVVLGTLTGAWQLITGVVAAVGNGAVGASAAVSLSLGVSATCMALAFLPSAPHQAPRLLPVLGAAFFAIVAAALQRRNRVRSDL